MSSSTPTSPNQNSHDLTPFIVPKNKCLAIVPYTGGSNPSATSNVGHQGKNECSMMIPYVCEEAEPIRVGIPLFPTRLLNRVKKSKKAVVTPLIIDQLNSGQLRTSLNRRPAWLPVGWTVWKVVRTAGKSTGHVDVYYYSPKLKKKFRSKKEVFNHIYNKQMELATNTNPEMKLILEEEAACVQPVDLDEWHSKPAGVYVTEVGGLRPELQPMAPPKAVREFRIEDMLSGREV